MESLDWIPASLSGTHYHVVLGESLVVSELHPMWKEES